MHTAKLLTLPLVLLAAACSDSGGSDGGGGGSGGGGSSDCTFVATGDVNVTTKECGATANAGPNNWSISIVADDEAQGVKGFISQWAFASVPAPGTYDASTYDPGPMLPPGGAALTTTDGTQYGAAKAGADGGLELTAVLVLTSLEDAPAAGIKFPHGKLTASLTETVFTPDAGALGKVEVTVDF